MISETTGRLVIPGYYCWRLGEMLITPMITRLVWMAQRLSGSPDDAGS